MNYLETDLKPFSNKMFFFRKDCFYFVVTFVVLNELTDDFAALCAILGEIVFFFLANSSLWDVECCRTDNTYTIFVDLYRYLLKQ